MFLTKSNLILVHIVHLILFQSLFLAYILNLNRRLRYCVLLQSSLFIVKLPRTKHEHGFPLFFSILTATHLCTSVALNNFFCIFLTCLTDELSYFPFFTFSYLHQYFGSKLESFKRTLCRHEKSWYDDSSLSTYLHKRFAWNSSTELWFNLDRNNLKHKFESSISCKSPPLSNSLF